MWGTFGDRVTPATGAKDAAWIESQFDFRLLNCRGYERYLRIDHSLPTDQDQWSGPPPTEVVATIAGVAAAHTSAPADAHFAVWDGHGWLGTSEYWINVDRSRDDLLSRLRLAIRLRRFRRREYRRQARAHRALHERLSAIPKLELQEIRSYYLLTGPVDAACFMTAPGLDPEPQVPDLWWPADRSWFVGSDIDLDWTVVGGSEQLVQELAEALPDRSRPIAEP